MKFYSLFLTLILFFPVLIFPELKIFDLNCVKGISNNVFISWKASEKKTQFHIYRNSVYPIVSLYALKSSVLVARIQGEGAPVKNGFLFSEYQDTLPNFGQYYYAVLPANTNYNHESLVPGWNALLFPVVWKTADLMSGELTPVDEAEKQKEYQPVSVSKIVLKTNQGSVFIFWETIPAYPDRNIKFNLYRTRQLINTAAELTQSSPFQEIWNDTVYEDSGMEAGIPYYYTILADEETEIKPGINQNILPFWLGNTNSHVKVTKEIVEIIRK